MCTPMVSDQGFRAWSSDHQADPSIDSAAVNLKYLRFSFCIQSEEKKCGDRKKHPAQHITEPTSYFRNWCFILYDGFHMSIKTSVHCSISQVSVQFSSQFAIQNLQFFYALPQVAPPKSRHSKQFPVRLPYPPLPLARPHQPGPGNSGWVEDLNSGLVNITW